MDLHLGELVGDDLEVGYSGAYQGGVTIDAAASAAAGLSSTAETTVGVGVSVDGTAAAVLSAQATSYEFVPNAMELGELTNTTLELGTLGAGTEPGAVNAASSAASTLAFYNWPYALTAHGTAHPNSIMSGVQFASFGPVQLSLPTGGDPSVATIDFGRIDAEQGWTADINEYATVVAAGDLTYTFEYRVFETGAAGTFDVTVSVYTAYDLAGNAALALSVSPVPAITRSIAGASAGTIVAVASTIVTQDGAGTAQADLSISAQAAVDRRTGGDSASTLTVSPAPIDVSSEGASFVQSSLFATGTAYAFRVVGGAAQANLTAQAAPGQGTEVSADGTAIAALTQTGEFVRTYSVASFQGSTLTAEGRATDTVLAEASGVASGVAAAEPEVTRGVESVAAAVLSTTGDVSIGRSAVASSSSTLSVTADAFIDRGFELAADASSALVAGATPVYDAVTDGTTDSALQSTATPAVTRGVIAASVADLFAEAVPARDIEVGGTATAAGVGSGTGEAGLVIRVEGAGAAAITTQAAAASTISALAQGGATLLTVGQGATNQEGQGSAAAQLRIAAETLGGTPVQPGALSIDKVAIFPSMSCYTKVTPALYGDTVIRTK